MKKKVWNNKITVTSIILAVIILMYTYGCRNRLTSLISGKLVTRSEFKIEVNSELRRLKAELANLEDKAMLGYADFDKRDEIERKIYDIASITTQAGNFNATGLISIIAGLLGIGAVADNRIKAIGNKKLTSIKKE